jgi:hypothetical protein
MVSNTDLRAILLATDVAESSTISADTAEVIIACIKKCFKRDARKLQFRKQ